MWACAVAAGLPLAHCGPRPLEPPMPRLTRRHLLQAALASGAPAALTGAAPAAFATTAALQRHSERAHASRGAVVSVASGRIARQRAAPSLA